MNFFLKFWNFFQYESRRTVDVTNNRTRWEKHLNDVRLEDRLIDIEKWRNELERVLRLGFASDSPTNHWTPVVGPEKSQKSNADQEIRLLQDFKDNCDHALAQKAIPESVNAECLGKITSKIFICRVFTVKGYLET